MNQRTWTFPDIHPKTPGPWSDEPDKAQWVDDATGLDCLIVRNRLGALCGYVGVPPGHPWHGKDYGNEALWNIDVHGGLTFADACQEGKEDGYGICHVPEPGRPAKVWWFGFDCAHAGDLVPGMADSAAEIQVLRERDVYRDFDYVRAEVAQLAKQLAEAKAEPERCPMCNQIITKEHR